MLTLKRLGKLVEALKAILIFTTMMHPEAEKGTIPPCDKLVKELLKKSIHEIAISIVIDPGGYRLNGAGLVMFCYEADKDGEYKIIVRGDQYGKYPATGPAINEILVLFGLQEKSDSAHIKIASDLQSAHRPILDAVVKNFNMEGE